MSSPIQRTPLTMERSPRLMMATPSPASNRRCASQPTPTTKSPISRRSLFGPAFKKRRQRTADVQSLHPDVANLIVDLDRERIKARKASATTSSQVAKTTPPDALMPENADVSSTSYQTPSPPSSPNEQSSDDSRRPPKRKVPEDKVEPEEEPGSLLDLPCFDHSDILLARECPPMADDGTLKRIEPPSKPSLRLVKTVRSELQKIWAKKSNSQTRKKKLKF